MTIDIPIPRNALFTGSLEMRPWDLRWLALPLLIAVAAGAAGGLRSGRHELVSYDPWGRRAAGAAAGGVRMFVLGLALSLVGVLVLAAIRPGATKTYLETVSGPPPDQAAVVVANQLLLLPNQSMWVLVPAMGGCDGLSGGGVSATFLCYSKVPTRVSVNAEDLTSGTPVFRAGFTKATSAYLPFLLVPALSVVLGGRHAARKRARLKWEAVGMGAASGVVFAVLVGLGSWFASVSVGLSSPAAGIPANASVMIGPGVLAAGLLALAWGSSEARSGMAGGRRFPPRAQLPEPSEPPHAEGNRPAGLGSPRLIRTRLRKSARGSPIYQGDGHDHGILRGEEPGARALASGCRGRGSAPRGAGRPGMLIEDQPDMQVLAEAGTADERLSALRRIRRSRLVVLVGLGLPGARDSLWLIGTLRERSAQTTILASGAGAMPRPSRAAGRGADGYLDKDVDPAEYLQAIRRAAEGEFVLIGHAGQRGGLPRRRQRRRAAHRVSSDPTRARGVEGCSPGHDGAGDRATSRRS